MIGTTTITSTNMSSTGSNSPVAMEVAEEPRKKGARGGKRSVTHLSKAQLARKRANDREAQRNIRQRTKEHIETLERKVKELEQGTRSSDMERVLKKNKELEDEIKMLRAQMSTHQNSNAPARISPEIPEELLVPQKVTLDWMPHSPSSQWRTTQGSHGPALDTKIDPASGSSFTATSSSMYTPTTTSTTGYEDESSQSLYTGSSIWETSMEFGPQATSQAMTITTPAWAPFHPTFNQPSRFSDLQTSGFKDMISNNPNSSFPSTCWQNQPSVYTWQISTKLKAPSTFVDQLMISVIHSQRHLALTADLTGEEILGPSFPSVHLLFDQPGPVEKKPSNMADMMAQYSAVLSNRGFALIPEKLASFMCMYRFVQWQISPTYQTFRTLHEWQTPRPSQLMIPHPSWMDLPPWGKFRDKVIENQERYDNVEFQNDYAQNLSVNFPHDPMKALIFDAGQILISPVLDKHLSDITNMSMKKPFADKYPEFRDVCRFDEV